MPGAACNMPQNVADNSTAVGACDLDSLVQESGTTSVSITHSPLGRVRPSITGRVAAAWSSFQSLTRPSGECDGSSSASNVFLSVFQSLTRPSGERDGGIIAFLPLARWNSAVSVEDSAGFRVGCVGAIGFGGRCRANLAGDRAAPEVRAWLWHCGVADSAAGRARKSLGSNTNRGVCGRLRRTAVLRVCDVARSIFPSERQHFCLIQPPLIQRPPMNPIQLPRSS